MWFPPDATAARVELKWADTTATRTVFACAGGCANSNAPVPHRPGQRVRVFLEGASPATVGVHTGREVAAASWNRTIRSEVEAAALVAAPGDYVFFSNNSHEFRGTLCVPCPPGFVCA